MYSVCKCYAVARSLLVSALTHDFVFILSEKRKGGQQRLMNFLRKKEKKTKSIKIKIKKKIVKDIFGKQNIQE